MDAQKHKAKRAQRRRFRVRKAIYGTPQKPRLSVFRSNLHIYAQLIDDLNGVTLPAASSSGKKAGVKHGANVQSATGARNPDMARDRRDRGDGDARDTALVDFVVKIRRSACVVKGGRRFSFNALVVVGYKRGKVSYCYGKANEVPPAVEKAIKEGEGNVHRQKKISLRGNTIPHRAIGRYGASKVILVPAGPGTGVKAGPGVREVLQACGITNILTKVHGSTNPQNLVKATIAGLLELRTREEVQRLRGVTI